jgi:hypothetical protein
VGSFLILSLELCLLSISDVALVDDDVLIMCCYLLR